MSGAAEKVLGLNGGGGESSKQEVRTEIANSHAPHSAADRSRQLGQVVGKWEKAYLSVDGNDPIEREG